MIEPNIPPYAPPQLKKLPEYVEPAGPVYAEIPDQPEVRQEHTSRHDAAAMFTCC